ncbi:GH25 family lysozyme [Microlunatus sp. Gsoil 973]|uniref:GH25 family lysozyme n=1 Tax=Microlunatus sp. Gsoil 973 TaxID=2672569 RepID=UPI0012B4FC03|nr:GH25 family lysozyme [Microlunatus sp. Gsoil 973]QGN32090.1 lysozyme [Microlunatus sp. Gsoil 973]
MSRRPLALGALGFGLSVVLTVGVTQNADATPRGLDRTPSAAAAAAGITAAGGGYAGWSGHLERSSTPTRIQRSTLSTLTPMATGSTVPGIDVSSYNAPVNWGKWWNKGKRFVYIKATEGTSYRNPSFGKQYTYSYRTGFIRGSYHFGRPDSASGAAQARYFVKHGGGWSADGKTLPGALDLEQNYTNGKHPCWYNSDAENIAWAKSFVKEYKRLTSRDAVIYTNMSFWKRCMGNTTAFRETNPLWFAYYGTPTSVPGGWPYYTFLQYSGSGMDLDRFSAGLTRLKALARNR